MLHTKSLKNKRGKEGDYGNRMYKKGPVSGTEVAKVILESAGKANE